MMMNCQSRSVKYHCFFLSFFNFSCYVFFEVPSFYHKPKKPFVLSVKEASQLDCVPRAKSAL